MPVKTLTVVNDRGQKFHESADTEGRANGEFGVAAQRWVDHGKKPTKDSPAKPAETKKK